MLDEGLELTWYCNARAEAITPKFAHVMAQAGCHQVFLGFESGCDEMLQSINKGETVAQLERGAALLKNEGINVSIGFIVGLPGETQESVNKSIALCNRVKPYRAQFTRFTPIPGSKLAEHYDTLGSTYGFHNRSGNDQVEEWLRQCYDACRYRPSV
jgi:anaerobic magnesium-protoporphyrin IX monomethyl ester cyclase